jgi:CBS domain-containing protein
MKVADLLKSKGQSVITVSPDEPVFQAMGKLIENKIGSLVVIDAEKKIVGIISERDIMRAAYSDYEMLKSKRVSQLMSTNIIVAIPEDDIDYIMGIMTQNRIRHLPIVTKDGIVGLISIGDIVKYQLEEIQVKNRYLEEYMYGHLL